MLKQYVPNHLEIQPDSSWLAVTRCPGQYGHAQLNIYLFFAGIFIPIHIWVSILVSLYKGSRVSPVMKGLT